MATHPKPMPCGELLLAVYRQARDANLKLDHVIERLADDYYRHFHDLYAPSLEESNDRFMKEDYR